MPPSLSTWDAEQAERFALKSSCMKPLHGGQGTPQLHISHMALEHLVLGQT